MQTLTEILGWTICKTRTPCPDLHEEPPTDIYDQDHQLIDEAYEKWKDKIINDN